MNKYISFSGGVESTTMCILYGADAKAITADTGSEHGKLYERIDTVEEQIREMHPNFEIIKVKGEAKHKGELYHSLEDLAVAYKYMPSGQSRYCTRIFKIAPIDNYLKEQGECELMIGLNADEWDSREGNWGFNDNVKYSYPLVDDGYTRSDCEEILREHGLHPNFPVYMSRGGCRMCFYKSEKEYKALYHLNKKEFLEVQAFEESIQDKRKKFYSILGSGKSLRMLADECEREKEFLKVWDFSELYRTLNKETACGPFCRR